MHHFWDMDLVEWHLTRTSKKPNLFERRSMHKASQTCECQAGDVEMESKGACDDFLKAKLWWWKILVSKIIEMMDLETSSIYCGFVTSQLKKKMYSISELIWKVWLGIKSQDLFLVLISRKGGQNELWHWVMPVYVDIEMGVDVSEIGYHFQSRFLQMSPRKRSWMRKPRRLAFFFHFFWLSWHDEVIDVLRWLVWNCLWS